MSTRALLAALCAVVTVLTLTTSSSAQSAAKDNIKEKSRVGQARLLDSDVSDRFDRWRTEFGSTPELERFIERFANREAVKWSTGSETGSRRLAKGQFSFDDMREVPDLTPEDVGGYNNPDLATLDDGRLGLVYRSNGLGPSLEEPPTLSPAIHFRTSDDGGETWSDPVVVADEGEHVLDYNLPSIAVLPDGRLIIVDDVPRLDFFGISGENHAWVSDDDGASWTEIPAQEFEVVDEVIGPIGGKIWVPDLDRQTGTVQYRTTEDYVDFEGPFELIESPPATDLIFVDAVQLDADNIIVLFNQLEFDPCCAETPSIISSSDGGTTWSELRTIVETEGFFVPNAISVTAEGVITVAGIGVMSLEGSDFLDVITSRSSDGGATFSELTAFTRYVGEDSSPTLSSFSTTAKTDETLLMFTSQRGLSNGFSIWYGLEGVTSDVDPPPYVSIIEFPGGYVPADRPLPVVFQGIDEAGVSSMQVDYTQGEADGTFPLFDDGQHGDEDAGDGIFGGDIGPFPFGPPVVFNPVAFDASAQAGPGPTFSLDVVGLHDASAPITAVTQEGAFGLNWLSESFPPRASARYPDADGFNYVYAGGMWAGVELDRGKTVMHLYVDNGFAEGQVSSRFGDWVSLGTPVLGPGLSDLDLSLVVNDGNAPSPLGLEVQQRSFQWSDEDAIIFEYQLTNASAGKSADDLAELFVSFYMDPDVPLEFDPGDDQVAYDADRGLVYAWDSGDSCEDDPSFCTDVYLGIQLLSAGAGKTATTPHSAARWTGANDPGRTGNNLDGNMFDLMTSGINGAFAGGFNSPPDDWRVLVTAPPFTLAEGASETVVFGLVFGLGLDDLLENADDMIARYASLPVAVEPVNEIPGTFELGQNYPNPFNPSTTIPFSVETASQVTMTVFDVMGREVVRVVDETLAAGSYTATFDASDLPSGSYIYRLTANGKTKTMGMMLAK